LEPPPVFIKLLVLTLFGKEIGIRKIFGARTKDSIFLLLWQFSIPVLVANVIAWPVAYYCLHHWLEGYTYRISLSPLYFIGAGVVALVIAWAHTDRTCRACGESKSGARATV
jgi:hypothetical protein